jgi:hypothetical protein
VHQKAVLLVRRVRARCARAMRQLRTLMSRPASNRRLADEGVHTVHVYVASYNTAASTELCIRSMHGLAGFPFSLTVGDSASTDGSVEMLARMEENGWLTVDSTTVRRVHADWLDLWMKSCQERFAVFVDSDVEFKQAGWLRDLVNAVLDVDAAMVFAEFVPELRNFVEPVGRRTVRVAPRPAPWLALYDVHKVRSLGTSFSFTKDEEADVPEGIIVYDVGAEVYRAVLDAGLRTYEMPSAYGRRYHHYGGLSWVVDPGARGRKKERDLLTVATHLREWRSRAPQPSLPTQR